MSFINLFQAISFDLCIQVHLFLFYNEKFEVLFCSKCKTCLYLNFIASHITKHHKEVSKKEVNVIINKVSELTICDAKNIKLPEYFKHYFEYLTVFFNAFQCNFCYYVYLSEKKNESTLQLRTLT